LKCTYARRLGAAAGGRESAASARRACGSRAGGGRAAARGSARAGGSAGGAVGRRRGRSGRAAALGTGARGLKSRTFPPVEPAVGSTYRRFNRR